MINKKKNICIIPARGGSKRIPNKNIKLFFNKPIIYYAIKLAKDSKLFDKIIVSSDSNKILRIAKKYNCFTHKRSSDLSDDTADTISVIRNVIQSIPIDKKFEKVCCVYPTSIFWKKKHLTEAFKKLKKKNNYVFSASKYSHPIQRSFYKKTDGLKMIDKKYSAIRTQDLRQYYYDTAQFYLGWKDSWIKKKIIFEGPNKFVEIPEYTFQDIDDINDWNIALKKWFFLNKKKIN